MSQEKAPSRLRYEERNPTISTRVPKEFKEALQAHLDRAGLSFGQRIQASIDSDDQAVVDTGDVWEKGYSVWYDRGVFDMLVYLFREGWTNEVQELESAAAHLDEEVSVDDWLAAMSDLASHVQDRFPER